MNATADRSAEPQAPAARLVARIRQLPLEWEDYAREIHALAPDGAAAFSSCARELAAALVQGGAVDERTGTA